MKQKYPSNNQVTSLQMSEKAAEILIQALDGNETIEVDLMDKLVVEGNWQIPDPRTMFAKTVKKLCTTKRFSQCHRKCCTERVSLRGRDVFQTIQVLRILPNN